MGQSIGEEGKVYGSDGKAQRRDDSKGTGEMGE
jgi:hypothetical protein